MILNLEKIFDEFIQNKISKEVASELLIHLIERSSDEDLRLKSLKILNKVNLTTIKIFKFLENVLISDSNQFLRLEAFNIIKEKFKVKGIKSIIHSINSEEDAFLIDLIDYLSETDPIKCKGLIIDKLKKKDEKSINFYLEENDLKVLSLKQLKNILFNYLFNKSIDTLYFHRHKIPLAFDLFGIE